MNDNNRSDHLFLRACRCEPVDRPPIWLMRQAGRYMAAYREIRSRVSFLELCKTPDLAAEVTLQPIERFSFDAAILFSDILVPAEAMGADLSFGAGHGPVIANPVRAAADVDRLRMPEPEEAVPFVFDAVRRICSALAGRVPLIGFAGAPFTLASYLVEGGSSRDLALLKGMAFQAPEVYHALAEKISAFTSGYLRAQIRAGVRAVQLFDTWAGALTPDDYERFALPHTASIVEALSGEGVPVILYVKGCATLLEKMKASGADVISVDWRIGIDEARRRLGPEVAVQGNLDPCALLASPREIERRASEIIQLAGGRGHIFNLGHGILPGIPEENVEVLVEAVKRYRY